MPITEEYKEGIYFGMPEEEYFKIPFFSNSGAAEINIDPHEYWHYSAMNPNRPAEEQTYAMLFGKAMHSIILEPDKFPNLYTTEPDPLDYNDIKILTTSDDIKAVLKELALPVSGTKPELIARLLPVINNKTHLIWELVLTDFEARVSKHKLRTLKLKDKKKLMDMKASIDKYYPKIRNALSCGYSEVVIIWRDPETGVMCKARLDYLRIEAIGDLKTFSLKGKKNIHKAICDAVVWERYNVQYVIYLEAVQQLIKKIRLKKAIVVGDVSKEWLDKFLVNENKRFFFAFIRSEEPYQGEILQLQKCQVKGASTNVYHSEGENLFRIAINIYAEYLTKYGTNPWINENYIRTLVDEEVPSVMNQSYAS